MWLNQLFIENPIDFEKRCRNRIVFGICFILLGAAAIGLSFAVRNRAMVMYLEPDLAWPRPVLYPSSATCSICGIRNLRRSAGFMRPMRETVCWGCAVGLIRDTP